MATEINDTATLTTTRDSDSTHASPPKHAHTFRDLVVMRTKRERAGCHCEYHRQKKCEKTKLVSTCSIFPMREEKNEQTKSCYTWVVSLALHTFTGRNDFLPLFLAFVLRTREKKKKRKKMCRNSSPSHWLTGESWAENRQPSKVIVLSHCCRAQIWCVTASSVFIVL